MSPASGNLSIAVAWRSVLAMLAVDVSGGVPVGLVSVSLKPAGIARGDAGDFMLAASRVDRWLCDAPASPALELAAILSIFKLLGADTPELAIAQAIDFALKPKRGGS